LKLPYVAIAVKDGDRFDTAESYGKLSAELVTNSLTHQGEVVGQLLVARRSPKEAFTEADQRLLRSIARQAGTAVHAVQLTADLQRSRQRLVTAREEERRRLRRDLHDGLGPTLAALMLKIGSVQALLEQDTAVAGQLLAEMENDIEVTLSDIRRLVYNLRPPALDQLGLLGAIQECAVQYEPHSVLDDDENGRRPLTITVNMPPSLPPLPAAVEVAAYRIVQEGLTNVTHHAQAQQCLVSLEVNCENGRLHLNISDDGQGLPDDLRAGVGLTSMRERAEEVGGTFTIETAAGKGTRILVELPLDIE
jgi:signal transduction histidine kinase